jgi:hypothetical protein
VAPSNEKYAQKSKIHCDNPKEDACLFNFEEYIEGISEIILNPLNKTPFSIAINGRWGSGKTSLMQTLRKRLVEKSNEQENEKHRKVRAVWFDAWKYPETDNLLAALALEIHEQLSQNKDSLEDSGRLGRLIRDIRIFIGSDRIKTERVIDDFTSTSMAAVGLLSGVGPIGGLVPSYEGWIKKPIYKEKPSFYNEFNQYLRCILKHYILDSDYDNGNFYDELGVLVIFIDDLDRCPPKVIANIMESINLFFDQQGCIFVFGMDINLVSKAIDSHYQRLGVEEKHGFSGREYIKKMIQLEFTLPAITIDGIREYIERELQLDPIINQYSDLIISGIDPNPREIKRFFNTLNLMATFGRDIQTEILIKWVLLNFHSEPFIREVVNRPKHLLDLQRFAVARNNKEYSFIESLSESDRDILDRYKTNAKIQEILLSGSEVFTEENIYECIFLSNFTTSPVEDASIKGKYGGVTITASGTGVCYLGEELAFSGTCTMSRHVYLFIAGPGLHPSGVNLERMDSPVTELGNSFTNVPVANDDVWEYKWNTSKITEPIEGGTYKVYAVTAPLGHDALQTEQSKKIQFATVSILLKKPFITASVSSGVISQGASASIVGTAVGNLASVYIWIFGPEFFRMFTVPVKLDGTYRYNLDKSFTQKLMPGQYFILVQHPGTNGIPDVINEDEVIIYRNDPLNSSYRVNISESSKAISRLIEYLDKPNCDDIYTKLSFLIEQP